MFSTQAPNSGTHPSPLAWILGIAQLVSVAALAQHLTLAPAHAGSRAETAWSRNASGRDYIIGGIEVDEGDPIAATTVALINRAAQGASICTGSIVANDLIVTAGHCVGPSAANMRIAFKLDVTDPGISVPVQAFVRHSAYNKGRADQDMNDIALVRFEGGLPRGFAIATVLDDARALSPGTPVTLAGYGITDAGTHAGAGSLRKTDVTVARAWGRTEIRVDQTQGRGACHGDSGGPAFVLSDGEYRLFGVTSRGPSDQVDDCATEGIYTNLLAHKAFLRKAATQLRRGT